MLAYMYTPWSTIRSDPKNVDSAVRSRWWLVYVYILFLKQSTPTCEGSFINFLKNPPSTVEACCNYMWNILNPFGEASIPICEAFYLHFLNHRTSIHMRGILLSYIYLLKQPSSFKETFYATVGWPTPCRMPIISLTKFGSQKQLSTSFPIKRKGTRNKEAHVVPLLKGLGGWVGEGGGGF